MTPRRGAAAEPSTRRAMILYAIGAFVGLAAAAYELLTAQGTVTRSVPPEDVALINQQPILRSDFVTQTEAERGEPFEHTTRAEQLRVLDEMINEELRVQRGLELGFAETDQDSRNALSNVVDQQMVAEVALSRPAEQELMDFYALHRSQYHSLGEMTVCDLALPASGEAAGSAAHAAVDALRGGTPLPRVLERFGLVNKNNCENNYYFGMQIHLGERLYAAALAMPSGTVSEPLQVGDSLHVLQMLKNIPQVPESFSDARSSVVGDYNNYREARSRAGTLSYLRRRAKILIAPDYRDYRPMEPGS